jgi:hypothetical protein
MEKDLNSPELNVQKGAGWLSDAMKYIVAKSIFRDDLHLLDGRVEFR